MMKSKMCAIIKIICKNIKLGAYCLWKWEADHRSSAKGIYGDNSIILRGEAKYE